MSSDAAIIQEHYRKFITGCHILHYQGYAWHDSIYNYI